MKKKLIIAVMILGCAAGCGKIPTLSNGDEAVVSLNDGKDLISVDDLYASIKDDYALTSLINLVDTKILLQEYPDVADDAADYASEQLTKVKSYYVDDDGNYDEDSLLSALSSYYGVSTIDEFTTLLTLNYYRQLAITDYAKDQITDDEIQAYYDDNTYPDIDCSHILISPDTTDDMTDDEKSAAEAKALATAKSIIKQLDNGADFATLAKKYSDDDATASDGGELGSFNYDDMEEAFSKAAYALDDGEYTETPVETSYGYHIILKNSESEKDSLDDVKDDIITTLANNLVSDDSTVQINALVELRKTYGMKIEDSDLASKYETYISNQLISAQSSDDSSSTSS